MEDNKYLEMFLSESFDYMESMNNALLEIENGNERNENIELIFRNTHTLKGMASAMNFISISEVSHALEDVFSQIKSGKLDFSLSDFDLFYAWLDDLKAMLDSVAETGKEPEGSGDHAAKIRKFLSGTLSSESDAAVTVRKEHGIVISYSDFEAKAFEQLLDTGKTVLQFTINISKNAVMPSVRVFQITQKLSELGTIIKTIPAAEELEESEDLYEFVVFFTGDQEPNETYQILNSIREVDSISMEPISKESLNSEQTAPETPVAAPSAPVNKKKKKSIVEPTIKVKISHLDALVNLIGELIINTIRLDDISKDYNIKPLNDEINNFQRITANLQDRILLARMVPVGHIFNKYPRIVRDISRKFNKKVNITITGSGIELDRVILDEIDEPLIHLLRNAVDHGVETPKERKKLGKAETANINLIARREKNRVVIEVNDDGNGLDINKIQSKALKMGVVTKEKLSTMSKSDVFMLICKPGFSTSDKVTELSGRGVGMDVVKNKIDSLNGVLKIESAKGKGTNFHIVLPMTLAIIQTLIVSVRGVKFLIPISNIQETMEQTKESIQIIKGREVIFLRDELVVPLIRMDEVLGFERQEREVFPVIFVELGDKIAGLVFDQLHSKQQTVIKNLDSILKKAKLYSGKGLLSNGEPALILDIAALLE